MHICVQVVNNVIKGPLEGLFLRLIYLLGLTGARVLPSLLEEAGCKPCRCGVDH